MTVQEIASATQGVLRCGEANQSRNLTFAFASDLMSDVLTVTEDGILLITGLATVQTVRTATMADVDTVLLVRGKQAPTAMIALAEENGLVIIESPFSMFRASGVLFTKGLSPIY
ncbi:MAG: DRTGG domain-containing protein [Spirochaetota bacterium]